MKTFVDVLVEKGERKGMRKGRKQEALKIAEAMKAKGMDVNTISELTGLTVDDVLRL
jgi:predicted transposase/invertase (TIGR01784 family)